MQLLGAGGVVVQMVDVFLPCIALTKTASSQHKYACNKLVYYLILYVQGGSNMTGTDLYVNKPHCAAAVRP